LVLTKRIIPCLDVKDGRGVKGVAFVELRDAGDPVEQAARYDAQGADEICFLDITASHEGRKTILDAVAHTAERRFVPRTVAGGGGGGGGGGGRGGRAGGGGGGQDRDEHRRGQGPVARPRGVGALRQPGDRRRGGRQAGRRRLGGVRPRRPHADRRRRPRLVRGGGAPRRGGDPPHQHGSRRDARRLRPRAHPRGRRPRARAGHRLGRRG